ncbi:carboxypeptidase regulatory-like domain-containing protein [Alkalihalobacillus sp. R86527]|uniref:carboxypeptidase regulatory-like domain-containing protein n=1 Tax=Alkalihalobacillus sp. R86527 TaxID=3093863 RepID=UPI00366CF241
MSFPNDIQYSPIPLGTGVYFDVTGDQSPTAVDLVGNQSNPSFAMAYDGTNVYFRLRLREDPRNRKKTGFQNFSWGVLFNTGGAPGTYQWLLAVDGLDEELVLIQNTVEEVNSWNDPAEGTNGKGNPNYSRPIINYDVARVKPANTRFGNDDNVFLDFFIPANILFDYLNITDQTPLKLISYTATNSNNYNKDSLRVSEGFQFTDAFSDPITVDDTNVKASLELRKEIVSGPASVSAGEEVSFTAQLIVENTGGSEATNVSLYDLIQFDILNTFSITSKTKGNANFSSRRKTLCWGIGNIAPGASAVLEFEVSGFFNEAGVQTWETASVTGNDNNTGDRLQTDPITSTITVTVNGGVVGIVSDQFTGFPVSDANVELKDGATTIATTTTNANGEYSFTGITPDTYTIEYSKVNYITTIAAVTINAGDITRKDVFLTELPGSISGTVLNSVGGPINNATILLVDTAGNIVGTQTTDATGAYSFPSVIAGQYSLNVTATNFQSDAVGVTVAANDASTVNFVLEPNPGTVQGEVRNEDGDPINGALVEVLNLAGSVISTATTNVSGVYTIDELAPGDYKIRFSKSLFTTQVLGFNLEAGETEVLNGTLQENPGTLTGTITDATTSAPLPGTTIQVTNGLGVTVATSTTDLNGEYTIEMLAPGFYTVTFVAPGYGSQTVGAKIQSEQTTTLDVPLEQLVGAISGTITDTLGNPVAGSVIEIFSNNVLVASTTTDSNGNYIINNLIPGAYSITASNNGFSSETVGASVIVNETSTADVTLTPNPGTLTGTVRSLDGIALEGVVLTIRDDRTGANITQVVTNNQGVYTATGLAPGNYSITALLEDFQSKQTGSTIVSDQTTTTDFILEPNPASVTGAIINAATGLPITDLMIEVKVVDLNGNVLTTTFTDLTGQYEVNHLLPGTYGIVASAVDFQTNGASVTLSPGEVETTNVVLTPAPGSITGTLTDTAGAPLSNVSIRVVDDTGFLVGTILTGTDGTYEFNGLAPGNYTITAVADSYQSASIGAIVQSNETTVVNQSLVSNPGSISGSIIPLVDGTLITLTTSDGILIGSTLTNPSGDFLFENLQPGQYIVTATAPNYQTSTTGATVLSDEIADTSLTLEPNPAEISGVITDDSGNPVSNATIQIIDANGTLLWTAGTDQDGNYAIGNLAPGAFTIVTNAQNYSSNTTGVTLSPGQIVTDANVTLIPDPGAIVGQINDTDGNLLPGATVIVRTVDNLQIRTTTTNEFGEYFLEGLAPGAYTVVATAPNYSTDFIGVIVSSNESTVANVTLTSTVGNITGTVVDENGDPITGDNTGITVSNENGSLLQTLVANSDGTFTIFSLQPGQYFINATATNYAANTTSANVVAASTGSVTVPLSLLPGTLTGRVINTSTSEGVPGATLSITTIDGIPITTTITGFDGEYTVENISAGTVVVSAVAATFGAESVTAVVNPGETKSVNVELTENPGFLTGYLTDIVTGNSIVGTITLFDENGSQVATVTSDGFGEFLTQGLTPGNYTALVVANDYTNSTASFSILPDEISLLSFALSPEPGTIAGTITNAVTGDPVVGATIIVRSQTTNGPTIATTITNENGGYEVATLSPSTYTLVVSSASFGAAEATTIVNSNETQTVDLAVTPNPGIIAGAILDATTGTPLSGVMVEVFNLDGILVYSTSTDENGFYQFTGLSPLQFRVVTSHSDYQKQEVAAFVISDDTTTLNFELAQSPGAITGTVFDAESDSRLVGAEVTLFSAQSIIPLASTITDGLGEYTVSGLVPGEYTVVVNSIGYPETSTGSIVSPNETTTTNVSLLFETASLTGTVVDSTGTPLTSAAIKVIDVNGVIIGIGATASDGVYSMGGLTPGTYTVQASSPDAITQSTGIALVANEIKTVDFALQDNPGTVSGTVVNQTTGEPTVGATVNVVDSNGNVTVTTVTDETGNYVVDQLPDGSYVVSTEQPDLGTGVQGAIVSEGDTTVVDQGLTEPTGSIFGVLEDVDGERIDVSTVGVRLLDSRGLFLQSTLGTPEGTFKFSDIAPGQYLVSITADGYQSKVVPVTVVDGVISELDITLFKDSGSLSGQVVDRDSQTGVPGVSVDVKDVANKVVANGTTDETGSFTVDSLPTGPLFVTASRDNYGTNATSVTIDSNETTATEIDLPPNPGSIQGIITSKETGAPIADAIIQVLDLACIENATVLSQADGRYLVANVSPGIYEIPVSHPDYGAIMASAIVVSGETTTLNYALPSNPGILSGVVTNEETGELVSGAFVQLRWLSPDGPFLLSTITDQNGEYSVEGLSAAIYSVSVFGGGLGNDLATVEIFQSETTVQNFTLFPLTSSVSGRVTDRGAGFPRPKTYMHLNSSSGAIVQRGQTDENGNYLFENFDPGEYTVKARNEVYGSAVTPFTAEPLEDEVINFELDTNPGNITGRVKNAVTNEFVMSVSVLVTDENNVMITHTLTDEDGIYLMRGLTPGTYTIRALGIGLESHAQRVVISSNETAERNFALLANPATVSGTVTDRDGNPLNDVGVRVFDSNGLLVNFGETSSEGDYVIGYLPGETLTFIASLPGYASDEREITVQPGSRLTDIDFILGVINPATIYGTVTSERTGLPIGGARITVRINDNIFAEDFTNSDGTYSISGLGEGDYTVSASAAQYETKSIPVFLEENENERIDFALEGGPTPTPPPPGPNQYYLFDKETGRQYSLAGSEEIPTVFTLIRLDREEGTGYFSYVSVQGIRTLIVCLDSVTISPIK